MDLRVSKNYYQLAPSESSACQLKYYSLMLLEGVLFQMCRVVAVTGLYLHVEGFGLPLCSSAAMDNRFCNEKHVLQKEISKTSLCLLYSQGPDYVTSDSTSVISPSIYIANRAVTDRAF